MWVRGRWRKRYGSNVSMLLLFDVANPRRACAARVTVLNLCVCVCFLADSYAVNQGIFFPVVECDPLYTRNSEL